jgi:hypothetical protein
MTLLHRLLLVCNWPHACSCVMPSTIGTTAACTHTRTTWRQSTGSTRPQLHMRLQTPLHTAALQRMQTRLIHSSCSHTLSSDHVPATCRPYRPLSDAASIVPGAKLRPASLPISTQALGSLPFITKAGGLPCPGPRGRMQQPHPTRQQPTAAARHRLCVRVQPPAGACDTRAALGQGRPQHAQHGAGVPDRHGQRGRCCSCYSRRCCQPALPLGQPGPSGGCGGSSGLRGEASKGRQALQCAAGQGASGYSHGAAGCGSGAGSGDRHRCAQRRLLLPHTRRHCAACCQQPAAPGYCHIGGLPG